MHEKLLTVVISEERQVWWEGNYPLTVAVLLLEILVNRCLTSSVSIYNFTQTDKLSFTVFSLLIVAPTLTDRDPSGS